MESLVRPVVEYACPVLPKYLSDDIEIIQNGVSKLYFLVLRTRIFCRW